MTKVQVSRDCGNSPKNKFVQKIALAMEAGGARLEDFSEDVVWERTAEEQIIGRDALIRVCAAKASPASVTIEYAISHGKTGAASGHARFETGETRRFSHVLEFTSAKANRVSVIKSYT